MKYYNVIFSLLLLQCSYACGNTTKNNSQKSPEKDICSVSSEIKYPILFEYDKKYPQRELTLHDIADITYSKFSDKDVLFDQGAGGNLSISDQFKIIHNPKEGTIFVFDKNNKLINKFNRTGGGPEEYQSITELCVDFNTNEIFIFDYPIKYKVLVYSFDGKFKRELGIKRPLWVTSALDYNKENMLICFNVYKGRKTFNKVERQYHLLSKENGWLTPIAINIKYPISNTVLTSTSIDRAHTRGHMFGIPSKTIIKNGTNVIISDYGSDTIYLKNNKGLHPLIAKYPSVQDNEEPTLVYALARTDKYTFLRKIIRRRENNGMTDFVVENQTGEIFELKITNQDFPSKNFIIETFGMNLPQNTVYSLLPTNAYIERNEKKQLSGKLKELVSTLTDDDNNFLISIKYR